MRYAESTLIDLVLHNHLLCDFTYLMLDKHLTDAVLHNPMVWLHVRYAQYTPY